MSVARALGKYFGYPKCCVEEFLKFEHMQDVRKLYGTGFIPCKKCNETKSRRELKSEIARNRICPTPFPKQEDLDTETIEAWLAREKLFHG